MAQPSADQVQLANEVLAGTRQISGSSAVPEEPPPSDRQKALEAAEMSAQSATTDSVYGASQTPAAPQPTPEPPPPPTPSREGPQEPGY